MAILPPDNLLVSPCDSTEAGTTVRSLAKGYIENKSCINMHKQTLESLTKWKNEQEAIFKNDKSK